ncbi:MAG: tetratricopeptide repeat protein [Planctomycetota bacterium]|nr:tetratricopeptide repeat protein [Planctomycetota bacterium]
MAGKLQELFEQVIDLERAQREKYLASACGDDTALRTEIDALLRAHESAAKFMASPTAGSLAHAMPATDTSAATATVTAPLREGPGTRLGPYKILQAIGEGGFGSVFMAEQERPVSRKVAIKIIRLGMDTRQVVARFEQERQALAMMDHPNIAKVLDAGATETGRPFFVMELVKGDPIIEYADKNNLSVPARLELFAQVCNAVQHAHTKGIIHRDIKPSNILVSTQDGRPHAKVIDFGIAKATASRLTEKTLFTEHRQLIGTPEYMSPEQAEGSLDIDTRTDVYSLGVLLYELLTGTTPFTGQELRSAAYAEMQRIIREVEPPKPSTRLSSNSDKLASIAAKRHTESKRLGTLVRGELDWIVMKALEKDRQRRYETANSLGLDIKRYLSGEAVLAAPPSASYRIKKMIRRNKGSVAAGSAITATLTFGLAGTAWQAKVASEQRDVAIAAQVAEAEQRKQAETARAEAVAQRTKAREQEAEAVKQAAEAKKQAEIAEAVATFQTDMLAAVDPANLPKDPATGEPLKDGVTVVQAIEASVRKLDADAARDGALKDQPLVEAAVRNTIGVTLENLGRYDKAEPNLRRSLSIRRAELPVEHPDIAASLNNLANVLYRQNKVAEAEPLFREALAIWRTALPAGHPQIATGLNNLASLLDDQNRDAEAEPLYRESLETLRAALPVGDPEIAHALNNLASFLHARNKLGEAEPLYREALKIRRATLPNGHPDIAISLDNLAKLLQAQNKLAEAEPLQREALAIRRAAFPAGHPDIARGMNNLAWLLHAQQNYAEAEPLFREALEIRRAALPTGHPDIAASLNNLAGLLQAQSKPAEAEPLFREALAIRRAAFTDRHPEIAVSLNNLAVLLQAQGKLAEAEPLRREAVEIWHAALPAGHPYIVSGMNNLALILHAQNKFAEAEALYREALGIDRAANPTGHPDMANAMSHLARLLQDQNRVAEAEPLFREALEIRRRSFPVGHMQIAIGLSNLARAQHGLGKTGEARGGWDEAIAIMRQRSPDGSSDLARLLWRSGTARLETKDFPAAQVELEDAVAMAEKILPADHPQLTEYRETLAKCKAALAGGVEPAKPDTKASGG